MCLCVFHVQNLCSKPLYSLFLITWNSSFVINIADVILFAFFMRKEQFLSIALKMSQWFCVYSYLHSAKYDLCSVVYSPLSIQMIKTEGESSLSTESAYAQCGSFSFLWERVCNLCWLCLLVSSVYPDITFYLTGH